MDEDDVEKIQELPRRQEPQSIATPIAQRGYQKLFLNSVMQADKGADFDLLMPPQTGIACTCYLL